MSNTLYLISDSTGETVQLVAKATTTQFEPGGDIEYRTVFNLQDTDQIDAVIEEAKQRTPCCFMYTLVRLDLRVYLREQLALASLPAYDIMEPALKLISDMVGYQPLLRSGVKHRMDASYYERIEAIEFAVKYDDGKYPKGFLDADIVLLGVSRTSKTPLSMFLANRGYKVANFPLIAGIPIPEEIFQINPAKVIGLTIDPEILYHVRQERVLDLRLPSAAPYAQREHIGNELNLAYELFSKIGCEVIDVSNRAIEETASRVISYISRGG
jgi:hypothetical protein